jgi:hypothetical protein
MRLAFGLVSLLVLVGLARGDFASGTDRSPEARPLAERLAPPDSARADSTAPEAAWLDALRSALPRF